ncbi:hypothetical protein NW762_008966 [Fusarium torreyae]|uniref:Uncharacterized protein n=1 Tax=Fusarium torreyae TaxID=1237075 RepID=A0A9W8RUW2_9HYPO|nr:hypothetical protein NW762_008966 [Fusarium torreyae]
MGLEPVRVPYNDEIRLGRGVNSFTLLPCLDNRVEASTFDRSCEDVQYESKIVHKLSEVASWLGIPYYPAIKKGVLELEDSVCVADETTFNSADANILIAIRVVNSKRCMRKDELKVRAEGGEWPGTHFNEIFGDSYCSELVEGGIAVVVLSITVLDRSEVKRTVELLEKSLHVKNDKKDSVKSILAAYRAGNSNSFSQALKGTRTHASVSCSGNGFLETNGDGDDIETILAAVSKFPETVTHGAGWAWVNLCRYASDPRIKELFGPIKYSMLDYTMVEEFAAKRFNDWMRFKCLLKGLQVIMNGSNTSGLQDDGNATTDLSLESLLMAREEIRREMAKIEQAMDVVSRDPWVILRQGSEGEYRDQPPSTDILVETPLSAVGANGVTPDSEVIDLLEPRFDMEQLAFDSTRLRDPEDWKHIIFAQEHQDAFDANNTFTVNQSLKATRREYQHKLNSSAETNTERAKKEIECLAQKFQDELNTANKQINHLTESGDTSAAELAQLRSEIETLRNHLKNVNTKAVNSEIHLADERKNSKALEGEIEKLKQKFQDQLKTANEQINHLTESGGTSAAELAQSRSEIDRLRNHLENANTQAAASKTHLADELRKSQALKGENEKLQAKLNMLDALPRKVSTFMSQRTSNKVLQALAWWESQAEHWRLGYLAGNMDVTVDGPDLFNSKDDLLPNKHPRRIDVCIRPECLLRIKTFYADGIGTRECGGTDKRGEWIGQRVDIGDSIIRCEVQGASKEHWGGAVLVDTLKLTTKQGAILLWQCQMLGDRQRNTWVEEAPGPSFSLRGFWGQAGLAIDRLGPVWSDT